MSSSFGYRQFFIKFPLFCAKLRALLDSGMSLHRALQILTAEEAHPGFRARLERMTGDLNNGLPFTESLGHVIPASIPLVLTHVDTVPHLPSFLGELEYFFREKWQSVIALAGKVTYPFFLACATITAGLLFLFVLLPSYRSLFADLGHTPPFIFSLIDGIYGFIGHHRGPVLAVVALGAFAGFYFLKARAGRLVFRFFFPQSKGDILWLLGVLMKSGLTIKQAVQCITLQSGSDYYQAFDRFKEEFFETGEFARPLAEQFNLDMSQREMLMNAERTGQVGTFLVVVAADVKRQQQLAFGRVLRVVQPALILCLGLMIFGLVYMVFVPVLSSL